MQRFDNHKLGETEEDVPIDAPEHHQIAATRMAQQCRRYIDIISRRLDPHAYNTPDFIEAVKQLVLNNRRAQVRIMVLEPEVVRRNGHRLLELAESLPSFIEFRKPVNEYKDFNESLLLADTTGYILRLNAERHEGKVNFNDKRQSKVLLEVFDTMWEKAKPDPNLRRMHL